MKGSFSLSMNAVIAAHNVEILHGFFKTISGIELAKA